MRFRNNRNRRSESFRAKTLGQLPGRRWRRALACLGAMAAFLTCAAWPGQQAPSPGKDEPPLTSKTNQPPDAGHKQETRDQQVEKQKSGATHAEPKDQIALDSAKLLKLATDLRIEVDKTTLDTLSLTIVRKADEIEKLAHSMREKMKVAVEPAKAEIAAKNTRCGVDK